jgi:hypothetical protein
MNSTMGLMSTLLNVYGIQGGSWFITAVTTFNVAPYLPRTILPGADGRR